jgi:hypothetical protein
MWISYPWEYPLKAANRKKKAKKVFFDKGLIIGMLN